MTQTDATTATDSSPPQSTSKWVTVWDPLVRIGHWLVVLGFFAAYLTDDDLLDVHVWAGYLVGAVVIVRIVWGFVGPQHARFSDFVIGPGEILRYLRGLVTLQGKRYVGHSPAGGAMVIALLVSLGATTGSGLALYAIEKNAGPLAGWMGQSESTRNVDAIPSAEIRVAGKNDERELDAKGGEAAGEVFWEELHEFFANFTLALVVFHIAGVLLASYVHRENLVWAMITGKKRA